MRADINPVAADAIREAARRVLEEGETVASILRDWTRRGIKPVRAEQWWPTTLIGTLTSARIAGLREWQGKKYPATQWPAIIDVDTHERLVKLFADPSRRKHVVRAPAHLMSGIAKCPKYGSGLHYRRFAQMPANGRPGHSGNAHQVTNGDSLIGRPAGQSAARTAGTAWREPMTKRPDSAHS